MIMKPNALLFDFDGVVVNSFRAHGDAWASAFEQLFNTSLPQLKHEQYAGKSPVLIAQLFADVQGAGDKAEDLLTLKKQLLNESSIVPTLLPGVHEIQKFAVAQHIPYGIASNANRQYVKNSIDQLGLDFEIYFGYEDYTYPKPHPEAYITLATRLGIAPSDFKNSWVFEDSLVGISAAREANMHPVGILTQYTEAQLLEAGAKLTFPTLREAHLALEDQF